MGKQQKRQRPRAASSKAKAGMSSENPRAGLLHPPPPGQTRLLQADEVKNRGQSYRAGFN